MIPYHIRWRGLWVATSLNGEGIRVSGWRKAETERRFMAAYNAHHAQLTLALYESLNRP